MSSKKPEIQVLESGALREESQGRGRYELLDPDALHALAVNLERGAKKYAVHNYRKGIPQSRHLQSALRHIFQLLKRDESEDHAAAAMANMMMFISTRERIKRGQLPPELDDITF